MAINRTLVVVVLVAICIGLSLGRPHQDKNGKRKHKAGQLHKFMCKLQNTTDILLDKTCGCGNETDSGVTCSLGPLTLTKDDKSFEAFFCAVSPNWTDSDQPWRGALKSACKINVEGEVLKDESCGSHNDVDLECSVGPILFTVNETKAAEAYFCQRPERTDEDGDEGRASGRRDRSNSRDAEDDGDDEDEEEKEKCVPLSTRNCKGDDKKNGQRRNKDRSANTPNEPEALDVEGDDNSDAQRGQQRGAKSPKNQREVIARPPQERAAGDQRRQGHTKGKGKAQRN